MVVWQFGINGQDEMSDILLEPEVLAAALGAILGAVAAFTLVVVRDSLNKIDARKQKHYNALVKLEAEFTVRYGIVNDNLYIIPHFAKSLNEGSLYWSVLGDFAYDASTIHDLHNTELKNDIFSHYESLRKVNTDIRSIMATYKLLEQGIMGGSLAKESFDANAVKIAKHLTDLKRYLEATLQPDMLIVLAKIRILIEKDLTRGMKTRAKLVGQTQSTPQEVEAEARKLVDEIIGNTQKDEERNKKMAQKVKRAGGKRATSTKSS